jgi:hypothetical protein
LFSALLQCVLQEMLQTKPFLVALRDLHSTLKEAGPGLFLKCLTTAWMNALGVMPPWYSMVSVNCKGGREPRDFRPAFAFGLGCPWSLSMSSYDDNVSHDVGARAKPFQAQVL